MKRAILTKDGKGIKRKGLEGWVRFALIPKGWDKPLYAFYPDGHDEKLAVNEEEFEYMSDIERY
jgi:hypothetical protein